MIDTQAVYIQTADQRTAPSRVSQENNNCTHTTLQQTFMAPFSSTDNLHSQIDRHDHYVSSNESPTCALVQSEPVERDDDECAYENKEQSSARGDQSWREVDRIGVGMFRLVVLGMSMARN